MKLCNDLGYIQLEFKLLLTLLTLHLIFIGYLSLLLAIS